MLCWRYMCYDQNNILQSQRLIRDSKKVTWIRKARFVYANSDCTTSLHDFWSYFVDSPRERWTFVTLLTNKKVRRIVAAKFQYRRLQVDKIVISGPKKVLSAVANEQVRARRPSNAIDNVTRGCSCWTYLDFRNLRTVIEVKAVFAWKHKASFCELKTRKKWAFELVRIVSNY